VLDAVRQLGNLPFSAVRKQDLDGIVQIASVARGLDPAIRKLCRDASRAINRYPVKDPFAFGASTEDAQDGDDDEEDYDDSELAGSEEDSEALATS
jgi:hypothetical protein